RVIELAIEEKNIDVLLRIAHDLSSKELADRAYQLLDRRHLSKEIVTDYLDRITTIDPTHIGAVIDLYSLNYLTASEHVINCMNKVQELYWGKNLFVEYVVMHSRDSRLNQPKSSFSEEEEAIIYGITGSSWRSAVCECFLKHNWPIDSLMRFWIN